MYTKRIYLSTANILIFLINEIENYFLRGFEDVLDFFGVLRRVDWDER